MTNDQAKAAYFHRSNWRGVGALLRDISVLFGLWYLSHFVGESWWFFIPIIWGIGAVQFAMGEALLHEASHNNLFTKPLWNKIVGNFIAYGIFTTLAEWRKQHLYHHQHLMESDDHLSIDYKRYRLHENLSPLMVWIIRPIGGVIGWQWLRYNILPGLKNIKILCFYSAITIGTIYFGIFDKFLLFWLLPQIWAFSSFLYWSEIIDHYLAQEHSPHQTRTNTSWLWNTLFHNGGYHWVHHQYAFIPWFLLPQANKDLTSATVPCVKGWWGMYKILNEQNA